jgi:hypothetical protein
MLKAASAVLSVKGATAQLQLAQLCVATGLLDCVFTAMPFTTAQLQAADAEVAAALAAGRGLPAQYRPQQRTMPLPARLAIALARLYQSICSCWPGPPLLSAQAGRIAPLATQLLLAAMRLAVRLLAGGNKEMSCKLLGSCLEPAVGLAVIDTTRVGCLMKPAEVRLLRSHQLPQLQLLLLTLALKLRCNEQHVPGGLSSSSSSSNRRQSQDQHVQLDSVRHKHLLAMLQEWGLSDQQAAAPLPQALAAASRLIVVPRIFTRLAEKLWCSTTVVQQYLAMGRYQAPEPVAAAMSDEQRAAYRELLRITQTGALMLLEAAYNLLECEPQMAADVSGAGTACMLCALLRLTTAVTTPPSCSSSNSATAEEVHEGGRAEIAVAAADGVAAGSSSSSSIDQEVTDVGVPQVVRLVSSATRL